MAGGMNKRGSHGSMAERVARSRERPSEPEPADAHPAIPPPPTVKHCWVTTAGGSLPGLLLAWELRGDGWQGRVVHPVLDDELGWIVAEEWLPAVLLEAVR
jgi:hypothetical protein